MHTRSRANLPLLKNKTEFLFKSNYPIFNLFVHAITTFFLDNSARYFLGTFCLSNSFSFSALTSANLRSSAAVSAFILFDSCTSNSLSTFLASSLKVICFYMNKRAVLFKAEQVKPRQFLCFKAWVHLVCWRQYCFLLFDTISNFPARFACRVRLRSRHQNFPLANIRVFTRNI